MQLPHDIMTHSSLMQVSFDRAFAHAAAVLTLGTDLARDTVRFALTLPLRLTFKGMLAILVVRLFF